jgi:hypothetical protein
MKIKTKRSFASRRRAFDTVAQPSSEGATHQSGILAYCFESDQLLDRQASDFFHSYTASIWPRFYSSNMGKGISSFLSS